MTNADERMKVLEMVRDGIISAEEAAQLLETMNLSETPDKGSASQNSRGKSGSKAKYFRIKVTDTDTNKARVNVTLPIGLINVAMKTGSKFAPEIDGVNINEIIAALEEGTMGKIIDVYDENDGEHVEVFID